ncbi:hypothetical protein A2U01_0115808, partial [Trifolium medium]|nr:hypothetical protein [Trifolium medium]
DYWRVLATMSPPPRLAMFKNVSWRLQEPHLATTRRAWCSVAV